MKNIDRTGQSLAVLGAEKEPSHGQEKSRREGAGAEDTSEKDGCTRTSAIATVLGNFKFTALRVSL